MKRIVFIILLGVGFCGQVLAAGAVRVPVAPENGFWVIVTRLSGPAATTVKYYDLQQHLVYEEHLDGVRLEAKNKRTCRLLNKKLELALAVYAFK